MWVRYKAQNHLVVRGTAKGSHHRGGFAMRSHHTGKEKKGWSCGRSGADYTDPRWCLTAIKEHYLMEKHMSVRARQAGQVPLKSAERVIGNYPERRVRSYF